MRKHAEAIAKAKYAETRDPKSCALFYAALGKKALLQVSGNSRPLVFLPQARRSTCSDTCSPCLSTPAAVELLVDSQLESKMAAVVTVQGCLQGNLVCCTWVCNSSAVDVQGLFRSASQAKQADFLARDFRQEKHKQAACKNAFVLLGQHKHELAAAFFILGMFRV